MFPMTKQIFTFFEFRSNLKIEDKLKIQDWPSLHTFTYMPTHLTNIFHMLIYPAEKYIDMAWTGCQIIGCVIRLYL